MYLILEGKVGVGGVGEWFDRGRKRTDEFGGDIVAKTEQDEAGECGSGEDFGKLVSGDEFGGYGGGEGGEVGGNDVIDKGRDGDIRGGRVRRSDTEQGYEGIECCDGARDDDTVGFGCYVFRDHKAKEKVTKGNGLTKILLLMQSNCSHQAKSFRPSDPLMYNELGVVAYHMKE
ncbi:hypothetical protein RJT34_12383 [Clitoria ternatea]|uniref:Uncharacterized protein n=1 Tax=Clitoria ternatea TaxID=43366 RepID=A0AAN9PLB7_CLITE